MKEVEVFEVGRLKKVVRYREDGSVLCEHFVPVGPYLEYDESGRVAMAIYYRDGRPISRRSYEKLRESYPELPAAAEGVDDIMKDLGRERRRARLEARRPGPHDVAAARETDERCRELLERAVPLGGWLDRSPGNRIGEMEPKSTRSFARRLLGLVESAAVVDPAPTPDGAESCDTVVAVLPRQPSDRARAFRWHNADAVRRGFDAVPDCGQRHLLLWFD